MRRSLRSCGVEPASTSVEMQRPRPDTLSSRLRRQLDEGFRGWRRPIVEACYKEEGRSRRYGRSDSWVRSGRSQDMETDQRRHPVGSILEETLAFRLRRCVRLHRFDGGRRNIPSGGIARRHAHSQRAHGSQSDHCAPASAPPTLAPFTFEMA